MKKKFFSIIIIFIMLIGIIFTFAGCGITKDNTLVENNNNNSSNTIKNNENASNITESNSTTSTTQTEKKNYLYLYGTYFYYPSMFTREEKISGMTGISRYSGTSNTGKTTYYFIMVDPFYTENHGSDFSITDTPNILADYVKKIVAGLKYKTFDSKYSTTVKNDSMVSINGTSFLKNVGSIHTETDENSADLTYVAYYGIFDFSDYSDDLYKVPVVIMTFSEANDEKTIKEMDESIIFTLENLE